MVVTFLDYLIIGLKSMNHKRNYYGAYGKYDEPEVSLGFDPCTKACFVFFIYACAHTHMLMDVCKYLCTLMHSCLHT